MRGIFRELWRYRWRLLTGVLALFVVDTLQLIAPLVVRSAVNDLVAGTGEHLVRYALYLVVIAAVVFGFRFLWRILLFGAGRLIERDMRNRLYAHLLKLSPAYYVEHSTGDLMAHATNDLEAVRRSCSQGVLMASDAVIMISVSLAAMIGISPVLTLYAFVPLPFITLAVVGFGRLIHRRFERAQAAFSALTERVREALSGVRLLRAFAREEGIEGAFSVTNRENVEANMALTRVSGVFDPAVGLLAGLGTVIILWFGGRGVLGGTLSLGDLVAFMNYLGMMVWPMMAIGWVVNTLQQGAASMKRLDRIFAEEPDITSPAEPLPMPSSRRIEFRDLTFTYPGTARPALRDVNLIVEEGTTLGVVGLTGSGKSTLVRLLPACTIPRRGRCSSAESTSASSTLGSCEGRSRWPLRTCSSSRPRCGRTSPTADRRRARTRCGRQRASPGSPRRSRRSPMAWTRSSGSGG